MIKELRRNLSTNYLLVLFFFIFGSLSFFSSLILGSHPLLFLSLISFSFSYSGSIFLSIFDLLNKKTENSKRENIYILMGCFFAIIGTYFLFSLSSFNSFWTNPFLYFGLAYFSYVPFTLVRLFKKNTLSSLIIIYFMLLFYLWLSFGFFYDIVWLYSGSEIGFNCNSEKYEMSSDHMYYSAVTMLGVEHDFCLKGLPMKLLTILQSLIMHFLSVVAIATGVGRIVNIKDAKD